LGLAGQQLVEWFSSVLDGLDASPPPPQSHLNLLLDRYRREATEVERLLGRGDYLPALLSQLGELSDKEVARTRDVLSIVDSLGLHRFEESLAQTQGRQVSAGAEFQSIRARIARALIGASPSGFGWKPEMDTPDEIVREMVDSSSEILRILLAR